MIFRTITLDQLNPRNMWKVWHNCFSSFHYYNYEFLCFMCNIHPQKKIYSAQPWTERIKCDQPAFSLVQCLSGSSSEWPFCWGGGVKWNEKYPDCKQSQTETIRWELFLGDVASGEKATEVRWQCGILARSLFACCVPRRVFTAAARFSKDCTRFCRSGDQAKEECWLCCVPQKLQTSYLLCLGSPRTADQRQARDMKATSSFRSASPSPLSPLFPTHRSSSSLFLLLRFPLICSPVLWHSLHLSHPCL